MGTPAHKDTSGDYEKALDLIVEQEGQSDSDLGVHTPAISAVSHPWLKKLVPTLEKLASSYHLGNEVATARGPNPPTQFESMPIYVRIGMQLLYHGKEQAKLLGSTRVNAYLKEQSIRQGKAFDSTVGVFEHIQGFVKTYKIDCAELLKPNIADYKTFNEFFARALRPGARPIDNPTDAKTISSAADCRLVVFESITAAQTFWVKGHSFSVAELLGDAALASNFEGGAIAIFRLAPADYHRFHSPVTAVVGPTKNIDGEYYTVNPVAINEDLDVLTKNKRDVTLLSVPVAGSTPMEVAFVSVGAMLVGSIVHSVKEGDTVERGAELGYFMYGGSTNITVFPPGKVQWDSDLLENSKRPIETAVRVGERIGTFI